MPGANSVTSNQETLHKDLEEVVRKYARTTFLRPIADHTREAFAEVKTFVEGFYGGNGNAETAPRAVILDSGCGTGESTIHIARRFPGIPVIGIDKSCARLNKGRRHPCKCILDSRRTARLLATRIGLRQSMQVDYSVPCGLLPEPVAKAKRSHETFPHAPNFSDAPCARKEN